MYNPRHWSFVTWWSLNPQPKQNLWPSPHSTVGTIELKDTLGIWHSMAYSQSGAGHHRMASLSSTKVRSSNSEYLNKYHMSGMGFRSHYRAAPCIIHTLISLYHPPRVTPFSHPRSCYTCPEGIGYFGIRLPRWSFDASSAHSRCCRIGVRMKEPLFPYRGHRRNKSRMWSYSWHALLVMLVPLVDPFQQHPLSRLIQALFRVSRCSVQTASPCSTENSEVKWLLLGSPSLNPINQYYHSTHHGLSHGTMHLPNILTTWSICTFCILRRCVVLCAT